MASVTLKNIKKIYPSEKGEGKEAIRRLDLDIKDGEFIVLVGPSGSGKSTVLRMIAGLEDPSEGEIFIDGLKVNDILPKDRDIAMVFQNYALYPHLTVYKNMAFALRNKGLSKDQTDARVKEAARVLGLTEYLNRKPKSLSGGEQQRVAIGRAIVRDPKVFLLDEPLSNLDTALKSQMRRELIELRKKIGSTFIYVTHDQTEAMTLGDRVAVLKDGVIRQIGTPYEIFNHPADTFVAGFIGAPSMNFFSGELVKEGGVFALKLENTIIPVPGEKNRALLEEGALPGPVTAGVRPDDMTLCEEDDPAALCATVSMFEMMGSSVNLHLSCCGEDITVVTKKTDEKGRLYLGYRPEDRVFVKADPGAVHLFDARSGKNLQTGEIE